MPLLSVYVTEEVFELLRQKCVSDPELKGDLQLQIETLAEAAVENAALDFKRDRPIPFQPPFL